MDSDAQILVRLESDFEDYYDSYFDQVDPGPGVFTYMRFRRAPHSRMETMQALEGLNLPLLPFGRAKDITQYLKGDRRPMEREVVVYDDIYWHGPKEDGTVNLHRMTLGEAIEMDPEQYVTMYWPLLSPQGNPISIRMITVGDVHWRCVNTKEDVVSSDRETGWISTWGRHSVESHRLEQAYDLYLQIPIWSMSSIQARISRELPPSPFIFDFEYTYRLAGSIVEQEMPGDVVLDKIRGAIQRYELLKHQVIEIPEETLGDLRREK